MTKPVVYLASPLGFADSTRPFMHSLVQELTPHLDILNPWDDQRFAADFARLAGDNDFDRRKTALHLINHEIARFNAENIDRADGLFAILDGVDVDSGTASEIGYAAAHGKFICGIRTDFRLSADNYGSIVNLQVQYFIESSGGCIVHTVPDLVKQAIAFASRKSG